MKPFFLSILLIAFFSHTFSQGKQDSVRQKVNRAVNTLDSLNGKINLHALDSLSVPGDSVAIAAYQKANTISTGFQKSADSLQTTYRKPINKMDSTEKALQHQIDSLTRLKLPTAKYTSRLDSITKARTQKITELNHQMDRLKSKANEGLKSIQLQPELQGPVNQLSKNINGYSIPMVNGKIPGVDMSSLKVGGIQLPGKSGNNSIPNLNGNLPGVGNPLNGITNSTNEITKVTGQAGAYGKDVKNITQGNLDEVKNLDKTAEKEAMKLADTKELGAKTAEMDAMKSKLNGRPDSLAMNMAKQEVMKEATNHFAGKEEVLKTAMGKMSKLKSRYSSVKSMAELPKKLPNPLHGLPFIERLIPGVTFQMFNKGHVLLDINPNAVYRITPRLSAGAGWVERIGFESTKPEERVYGPRAIVQFNWKSGFSLRFQPELLSTFVPPYLVNPSGDAGAREWVWSGIVGIKKEFKVYKSIRGTTEAMYNFYNPQSKSPYADRLMVRFGFEFPMKKR